MKPPEHPLLKSCLAMRKDGLTPSATARKLRVTRHVVIGVLYRHDHPERITAYDISRRKGPRPPGKLPRKVVHHKPSTAPFAPDNTCPDFAWDDDHCEAVLSVGGYPILPLRRAA